MRKMVTRFLFTMFLVLALAVPVSAASVTLEWDANPEPDIGGYEVFYGTSTRDYEPVIDVGNVTTYMITNLQYGIEYFFAVKAYNTAGYRSDFSEEVSYTIPIPNEPPMANAGADQAVEAGSVVTLNGEGSADDKGIASYAWTQTEGQAVVLQNADSAIATFTAPSELTQSTLVFRLEVIDSDGIKDFDFCTVVVSAVIPPAAPTGLRIISVTNEN